MPADITITDHFMFFWNGWPSQWFPSRFMLDGQLYTGCEQFMMAEKARVFGDAETLAKILAAQTPREQKALGRRVRRFEEALWNSICRGIVYTGNLAKFTQHRDLARALLDTGDRTLVEASPLDAVWGIGLAADHDDAQRPQHRRGLNMLGFALMAARP